MVLFRCKDMIGLGLLRDAIQSKAMTQHGKAALAHRGGFNSEGRLTATTY